MTFLEDTQVNNWQSLNSNSQPSNLIFIDTNLTDYQSLITQDSHDAVYLIDSEQSGIEQITEALAKYSNLDSVSIFSHGDAGLLEVGNTHLYASNLNEYQADLQAWGNSLSENGDLLFYGCNVGADATFVNQISSITSADVAASNDLTGNFDLGGDWVLEVATGTIETQTFTLTEYNGILFLNLLKSEPSYILKNEGDSNLFDLLNYTYYTTEYLLENGSFDAHIGQDNSDNLKFNFTYDKTVTTEQKIAFEFAGKMWGNVLNDDVTVNIHVSMASSSYLPANTLGGAIPFFSLGNSYSNFRNRLSQDRSTSDDHIAVIGLETSDTWQTYYKEDKFLSSGKMKTSQVALTRANAKALNLIEPDNTTLDGLIVLNDLTNTTLKWNTNYIGNNIESNQFDFTSVAMHEIGHILGFISSVDAKNTQNAYDTSILKEAATSLDLFRYIGYGERDLRLGWSGFSIDKGASVLGRMSWGKLDMGYQIDGYQASHWKNEDNAGLMDPVAELGQRSGIGELDLKALDVVGWDKVAGTKSVDFLYNEAKVIGLNKTNVNRNIEVSQMLADWRWARGGSTSRLRQDGNIAQFLAQQGFFSVGAFRESFDFSSVNTSEDASQTYQSNFIWDNFFTSLKEGFATEELTENLDLDSLKESLSSEIDSTLTNNNVENQAVNYQDIITSLTQCLAAYENSELNLEDLRELLQQPELVASVVKNIDD